MALPDISNLTIAELRELTGQTTAAIYAAEEAAKNQEANRLAQISEAIASLTALLGPVDAPAGTGSIRAVRAFDTLDLAAGKPRGTTMAANAPLALSLQYQGLELFASTVLTIAKVVASDG